jgi:hypothetical protein
VFGSFDDLFKASAALANTESVEDLERLLELMRRFRGVLAEHPAASSARFANRLHSAPRRPSVGSSDEERGARHE